MIHFDRIPARSADRLPGYGDLSRSTDSCHDIVRCGAERLRRYRHIERHKSSEDDESRAPAPMECETSDVDHDAFIDHLEQDLSIIDGLADDLGRAVPTCPGWDLGRLIGHAGRVHRMALAVLETGSMVPAPADQLEKPPADHDGLRAYYRASAPRLVKVLRETPEFLACWTFLGGPDEAAFWSRRMAHEHAVHRVDAQLAVGTAAPIPTDLAIDGVDEYFLLTNVRKLPSVPDFDLGGTVHLHATDGDGEWMLTSVNSKLSIGREHGKGDAAIRGTASDLLLGLWGRIDLRTDDRFERFGSTDPIDALASLGGN